ncbi:acetyltransferase [Ophiocordyceps camponoti-floridani]|uniref:Acetyltransferase n=1 Tax=Ophiocordyceps camponoti-floridani TaxID=2030778 RepID=A0A8H4Q673_9HYPO|nr:acetyltransferase [Ophiocordyceps camponoti-floridani]
MNPAERDGSAPAETEAGSASPAPTSLTPSNWTTSVRDVPMSQRREASFSLAYAFAADPLSVYLLSGDGPQSAEYTWALHLRIMSCTFAAYRIRGIVTTIGPDYDAIALWTPPGKFMDDWWATFRSGTWRLAYQLPAEARRRFFDELVPALHDTREETLGERNREAWYLGYIATKPSARGRGYASKLIRDVAQKADAENRPIYLESTSSDNNGFYAKFGFETRSVIELKRGPVPVRLYCMVREPQPAQLRAFETESSNEGVKA